MSVPRVGFVDGSRCLKPSTTMITSISLSKTLVGYGLMYKYKRAGVMESALPWTTCFSWMHQKRQGNSLLFGGETVAALPNSSQEIENLDKDYCDDFVCTSSPAVEANIRALSRDIARANGVWTKSLFSRNVVYKDSFRSFKGLEGYSRLDFVPKYLQKPEVKIQKMKMVDTSTAEIDWEVVGQLGPFKVDVLMSTQVTMNLLTGQIEKHFESWKLNKCSPPAAIAWNLARISWAARTGSADAARATNSVLESLTSMDDEDNTYQTMANPNDPMKFFQQKDQFKDDATFFIGLLLVFYIMFQVWSQIFKI